MTNQETVIINSLNDVNHTISNVSKIHLKMFLDSLNALRQFQIVLKSTSEITLKQDDDKKYIEIDYEQMRSNKFYLIDYESEKYAFKKSPNNELEIYDVI